MRQTMTAFNKGEQSEYQLEVLANIEHHLPKMNAVREQSFEKRKKKNPELGEASYSPFLFPSEERKFLSFGFLDGLFKSMKQVDYTAHPAQANQQVMRKVADDWSSFFAVIKDYKTNPHKYEGRPKMPRYKKKDGRTLCAFTNQVVNIRKDGRLKLPKTKLKTARLDVSWGRGRPSIGQCKKPCIPSKPLDLSMGSIISELFGK